MSFTLFLLMANVLVSVAAFQLPRLFYQLDLQPPAVLSGRQWHRLLSHAFVHADKFHLIVNLYVLYSFGKLVEADYERLFGSLWPWHFALLYFGGALFSTVPALSRHRHDYGYHGVGASGAVSALVFSFIVVNPSASMGIIFIPGLSLPAALFGVIYLAAEVYLDRKRNSRIAHAAHYAGAAFGILFTLSTAPSTAISLLTWIGLL